MDYYSGSLILFSLIALSSFFSGSETALTAINPGKVRDMVSKKVRGSSYIQYLKQRPIEMLVTILIGNNIVNIGASAYATLMFTDAFGSSGVGIATGVMTFLVLIFGEITPKSLANKHSKTFSQIAGPFLYYVRWILWPFVKVFSHFVKQFIKTDGEEEKLTITEDELKAMVSIGAEEGAINKREQEMIENILEFNDTKAADVMTPRVKIEGINHNMNLQEAIDFAIASGHSRYPVYKENLDNIVATISIKDLLQLRNEHSPQAKISKLQLRPMLMIPHFKKIHTLFRDFQKSRQHMAVVLDEHGGTSGIVTLEDLLEEIVGDILDEHDDEKHVQIEKVKKDEYMVPGEASVEDVCEVIGIQLPEAYYRSINYLILKTLSRFPHRNEVIEYPQCTIKVVQKSKKKIEKVLIKKK